MGDCVGDGDAVVYLPGAKVLFAGDLVIPGNIPYFKGRTQTVRNWIDALKRLEKLDIDTIVPGHGNVAQKDAITRQREFLEALVGGVDAEIKKGRTIDQTVQIVKLETFASWSHYSD